MEKEIKREKVDQLIKHFWQNGFLTLSRKYGTYLPEPNPIGSYNVDAVARQNKKFAIGIVLGDEDFSDSRLEQKLNFLSTRHTKYNNRKVTLFVGVEPENLIKAKKVFAQLNDEAKKNIKIVSLKSESQKEALKKRSFRMSELFA